MSVADPRASGFDARVVRRIASDISAAVKIPLRLLARFQ
jgi:hypothetical protein